jgi:hypothetical protein
MNIKVDTNFEPTRKWFENVKKGIGDARPLWIAMLPKIQEFTSYEFTSRNPNQWERISSKWQQWKVDHGFPATIGVYKGKLKKGAVDNAIIKVDEKQLIWKLNETNVVSDPYKSVKGRQSGGGYAYAQVFNKKRPIFKATVFRLNTDTYLKGLTFKSANAWIRDAK